MVSSRLSPHTRTLRELPRPEGWRGQYLKLGLAWLFGLVLLVVAARWTVVSALRGDYLTTAVMVGFDASLLFFFGALAVLMLGVTSARTTTDAAGFTLWPDEVVSVLLLAGMVVLIPASAAYAVLEPLGLVDIELSRRGGHGPAVVYGLVAVFLAFGLVRAWRRGGVGHIRLSPDGIEVADVATTRRYDWDEIVGVADHARSKRRAARAVVLRLAGGGEYPILSANVYLPRGAALYWLVRHYWKNPQDRAELVDERAPKRLQQARFDLA